MPNALDLLGVNQCSGPRNGRWGMPLPPDPDLAGGSLCSTVHAHDGEALVLIA